MLFTDTIYQTDAEVERRETKVLRVSDRDLFVFPEDSAVQSLQWLRGTHICWSKSIDCATQIWVADAAAPSQTYVRSIPSREKTDGLRRTNMTS